MPNVYSLTLEYKSLEILISNINFDKSLLGLFPYRAYVSHKKWQSDSNPKSLVVYEWTGGQFVYLISLVISIPWKGHKRLFSGNLPTMFMPNFCLTDWRLSVFCDLVCFVLRDFSFTVLNCVKFKVLNWRLLKLIMFFCKTLLKSILLYVLAMHT